MRKKAIGINEKTRHFGGKLSGFSSKAERNFQKAHLEAYLHGNQAFRFGFDAETNKPLWWAVKEVWE